MTNIVMLCRDRLRLTEQALDTLYSCTPMEEFSLTLVDDASEDFRVRRLLSRFGSKANASLLRLETSSHILARAKNLGVFWSRQMFGEGGWLYLSDSDVAFTPGWLGKLIDLAQQTELANYRLWGGQIHPFHKPMGEVQRWEDMAISQHQVLDGPSWLMRWATWRETGDLSRACAPGTCQSEDAEWCGRLVASGGRIGVISPHVVIHTGLTDTSGRDAPGRDEREKMIPEGVFAE